MNINLEQATALIQNRRSLYPAQYTGEVIEDSVINALLENANWAPTHKLTEPWRFRVFKGEGLKKFADFQAELYREVTRKQENFGEEKYKKLQTKPLLCSHIISIGLKRHPIIPELEEVASVACAVQNILLSASAQGLGCYWGTGGVTYFEEAKPYLDLEPEDKLMGFLYMGITESKWPAGRRKPIGDKVAWISE